MRLSRRKGALYTTVAGMELSWLYSSLLLLNIKAQEGSIPILWLLSFYPVAFVAHRGLRVFPFSRLILEALFWLSGMVWLLTFVNLQLSESSGLFDPAWLLGFLKGLLRWTGLPTLEQITFLSGAGLWCLGRRLARMTTDSTIFLGEFQFGLAALLIVFFIESQLNAQLPGLVPVTLAFFLFSLSGMAIAHAQDVKSWLSSLYRTHWLAFLIFHILLILAMGLLIGSVIKPDLLRIIVSGLEIAWDFVAGILKKWIAFLLTFLPALDHGSVPAMKTTPAPEIEPSVFVKILRIPESVRRVAEFLTASIWIALVLVALWRVSTQILRWLRQRLANPEGVEMVTMSGAFKEDLLRLLKAIAGKIVGWARFLTRPFKNPLDRASIPRDVASVRQIYRQLLVWAASKGCPRHLSQTPHEYLNTLSAWFPEAAGEFLFITDQYVSARYSRSLPASTGMKRLMATWAKVKQSRPKNLQ